MNGTISIILTTYNRSNYLEEAINGILSQKYPDYEIVIIDDNSNDDTFEVINKYTNDKRIKYYKNEKNLGPGLSRKKGYFLTTGDYVIFHDDDDYYTNPLFFSKVIQKFTENTQLAFVSGNTGIFNNDTKEIWRKKINLEGHINKEDYLNNFQIGYDKPQSAFSTVFSKKCIDQSGLMQTGMINDSSIYLYALLVGDAFILPDFIGRYRVHSFNISKKLSSDFLIENLKQKKRIYEIAKKQHLINNIKWLGEEYYLTYQYYQNNSPSEKNLQIVYQWCKDNDPHGIFIKKCKINEKKKNNISKFNDYLAKKLCKYEHVVYLVAYFDKVNFGDDQFVWLICKRYPTTLFICNDYRKHPLFTKIPNLLNISDQPFSIICKLYGISSETLTTSLKKRCEIQIIIGGSLFIETKNSAELIKNYSRQISSKPTYIIGANFGPYSNESFRKAFVPLFGKCKDVSFRDRYSYELFKKSVKSTRMSPDVLFADRNDILQTRERKIIFNLFNIKRDHDTFECDKTQFTDKIVSLINHYIALGYKITILSLCPGQGDTEYSKEIIEKINTPKKCTLIEYTDNRDKIITEIKTAEYMFAMRFHGVIYAFNNSTPVYPIAYSMKHLNMLKDAHFTGNYSTLSEFIKMSIDQIDDNRKNAVTIQDMSRESQGHFLRLDPILSAHVSEYPMKITVIMPVYNASRFLKEAVDSVLSQTYSNFELICVNDGSSDDSVKILSEYSDNRLIVINQINQGAGIARNTGISASTGEYVTFLDSDDMLKKDALEQFYKRICATKADLIISKGEEFQDSIEKSSPAPWVLKEQYVPNKECFNLKDYPTGVMLLAGNCPWSKCYRRNFLIDEKIEFPNLPRNEDIVFVELACYKAKSISILSYPTVMHRILVESSLENKGFLKNPNAFWTASILFRNMISNDSQYRLIKRALDNADLNRLYFYYSIADNSARNILKQTLVKEMSNVLDFSNDAYYDNKKALELVKKIIGGESIE